MRSSAGRLLIESSILHGLGAAFLAALATRRLDRLGDRATHLGEVLTRLDAGEPVVDRRRVRIEAADAESASSGPFAIEISIG